MSITARKRETRCYILWLAEMCMTTHFRKKDQAVTLACKTAVRLTHGNIQVDPQLPFQRLSFVATGGQYDNRSSSLRCAVIHQHYLIPHSFHTRLISPSWLMLSGLKRRTSKQPGLQETFTTFLMAALFSIAFPGHGALPTLKFSHSMCNT